MFLSSFLLRRIKGYLKLRHHDPFTDWRRFGAGKMEFRNGDLYTGEWDGAKGNGVISYSDESKYEVGFFFSFYELFTYVQLQVFACNYI